MPTDFRSPRFSGDAVLEEILRDPDTGMKKLGPGSPEAESIKKVQQALFDLMWTQRIDTPVSDPSQFVIGIFGPITSKTALAYKQHYDIHFPPDAPSGFIDHFVGPRTLDLLDEQCVLFDECDAALASKAAEVAAATGVRHDGPTIPILNTFGAMRIRTDGGVPGILSGGSGSAEALALHRGSSDRSMRSTKGADQRRAHLAFRSSTSSSMRFRPGSSKTSSTARSGWRTVTSSCWAIHPTPARP